MQYISQIRWNHFMYFVMYASWNPFQGTPVGIQYDQHDPTDGGCSQSHCLIEMSLKGRGCLCVEKMPAKNRALEYSAAQLPMSMNKGLLLNLTPRHGGYHPFFSGNSACVTGQSGPWRAHFIFSSRVNREVLDLVLKRLLKCCREINFTCLSKATR